MKPTVPTVALLFDSALNHNRHIDNIDLFPLLDSISRKLDYVPTKQYVYLIIGGYGTIGKNSPSISVLNMKCL